MFGKKEKKRKEKRQLFSIDRNTPNGKMGKEYQQIADTLHEIQVDMKHHADVMKQQQADTKQLTDTVISRFDRIEGTISGLRNEVAAVQQELSVVKKDMSERITVTEQAVKDVKAEALRELYAVEAKRSNLVLFGIPEPSRSEGSDHVSPRDQDIKAVDSILESLTGVKKTFDLRFRIGKKQDKPRPVLIKLPDPKDKEEILSKGHMLKDNPQWKRVYINEDLTPAQREHIDQLNKNLVSEANSKNAGLKNEDWKWVVRGRGMQRHLAKTKIRV